MEGQCEAAITNPPASILAGGFTYKSFCHCNFVGFADLCGLRPGFVGDAGLTPCIPMV